MEANIILTKETKSQMNKQLSNRHKGELRLKKLHEIAKNGKLQQAKSRSDVALLCGYSEKERANGYAWTSYLIANGKLGENITKTIGKYGRPECEYYLPNKNKPIVESKPIEKPIEKSNDVEPMKITIVKNDTTIEIENVTEKAISSIIDIVYCCK